MTETKPTYQPTLEANKPDTGAILAAIEFLRNQGFDVSLSDLRYMNGGEPMTAIMIKGVDLSRRPA